MRLGRLVISSQTHALDPDHAPDLVMLRSWRVISESRFEGTIR